MRSTLFSNFLIDFSRKVRQALADLGLFMENGIAKVKRLIAEVVQLDKLEMRDQATGEIYCT